MSSSQSACEIMDRAGAGRSGGEALDLLVGRVRGVAAAVETGLPHWADPRSGRWTTTVDGDWTGGAWIGMLWCTARLTGDETFLARAHADLRRLTPRLAVHSAFRGFPFYYGGVLGDLLFGDAAAARMALDCAASLAEMYSPALGLIPLGAGAEEGGTVGEAVSSIDSLQAAPLLFWASWRSEAAGYRDVARAHTARVLAIHQRPDGSIVQSSELDATGRVRRHFTHKGYSDRSTWGRAQAWGMLYAALAAEWDRERAGEWLAWGQASARWWIEHLPASGIAPWDFDDVARPVTPDTAATAIATVALLKLAAASGDAAFAKRAAATAARSIERLIAFHLTPVAPDDRRPVGMLVDACFNKRADARPQDAVASAEFIVGSFFLLQALMITQAEIGADAF